RNQLQDSVQRIRASDAFIKAAQHNARLQGLHARHVMRSPVATIPIGLTFQQALERCQSEGRGAYPVVDEQGKMVGICTRSDFYRAVRELRSPRCPLAEIMTKRVITARAGDPVTSVILQFLREPIKRLVVVADDDETRPLGIVTPFDILQAMSDHRPSFTAD